ncbi:hypothetical protein RJG79_08455 [Mycoplasmatota bacterium WC44]
MRDIRKLFYLSIVFLVAFMLLSSVLSGVVIDYIISVTENIFVGELVMYYGFSIVIIHIVILFLLIIVVVIEYRKLNNKLTKINSIISLCLFATLLLVAKLSNVYYKTLGTNIAYLLITYKIISILVFIVIIILSVVNYITIKRIKE